MHALILNLNNKLPGIIHLSIKRAFKGGKKLKILILRLFSHSGIHDFKSTFRLQLPI